MTSKPLLLRCLGTRGRTWSHLLRRCLMFNSEVCQMVPATGWKRDFVWTKITSNYHIDQLSFRPSLLYFCLHFLFAAGNPSFFWLAADLPPGLKLESSLGTSQSKRQVEIVSVSYQLKLIVDKCWQMLLNYILQVLKSYSCWLLSISSQDLANWFVVTGLSSVRITHRLFLAKEFPQMASIFTCVESYWNLLVSCSLPGWMMQ